MTSETYAPRPAQLEELRRAARDYVQRVVAVAIDTSEESLAFVDHYLQTVRAKGPVAEAALLLLACSLGVHLGDVAIAKFGGEWIRAETPSDEAPAIDALAWRVRLEPVPLVFAPIGMAAEAIRMEEVDELDTGLLVPSDLKEPLAEALSRVTVTDEEYFSLTGRLEGLTYAVEVLGELMRQKAERVPSDDDDDDEGLN